MSQLHTPAIEALVLPQLDAAPMRRVTAEVSERAVIARQPHALARQPCVSTTTALGLQFAVLLVDILVTWRKGSRLAQWRNVARRRSLRKEALAWNRDGSSLFVQLESAATWSCLALIGYCDVSECYCYGHRFEFHCTCCLVEKENRKIGSLKIVQMLQRVSKSAHHYGNIPIPERDATGIG